MRSDGRKPNELRPVRLRRRYTRRAHGSVLASAGRTMILCTVSVEPRVPQWLYGSGTGWLTAEYNMLPGACRPRRQRERYRIDGRTAEIQRLIGRSLRAVVDLAPIGEHTIWVDCDVLEADGGTRTLSITAAFVALVDAIRAWKPELARQGGIIRDSVAAVSVGVIDGQTCLDLSYEEDAAAEVDLNVVMTGSGRFIEVQGTAEHGSFSHSQLDDMLHLARSGIQQLTATQRKTLKSLWPVS